MLFSYYSFSIDAILDLNATTEVDSKTLDPTKPLCLREFRCAPFYQSRR